MESFELFVDVCFSLDIIFSFIRLTGVFATIEYPSLLWGHDSGQGIKPDIGKFVTGGYHSSNLIGECS